MNTTQQHLKIEDIKENLVFLKDGGVSLVLQTSAVNFGLLSEEEQLAIILSFAGLLNSLSFAIQIVVRSERLDVSSYLGHLTQAQQSQTNPLLSKMISFYRDFVTSLIRDNEVLDKQFYVVINVSSPELGLLSKTFAQKLQRAQVILTPRRDHLIRQLARVGLSAKQLATAQLVKLLYDIYNGVAVKAAPVVPKATSAQPSQAVIPPKPMVNLTRIPPQLIQPPVFGLSAPSYPLMTSRLPSNRPPFIVEELTD